MVRFDILYSNMKKKFKISKNNFVIDVESDGQNIFKHNMISFGIVNIVDPSLSFLGELYPVRMNDGGDLKARSISGVTWEEQLTYKPASEVMKNAREFVTDITGGQRARSWSDNPAYDFGWINTYMHEFTGDNIFGFSCRRIGDLHAGLLGDPFKTQEWKKFRKTKHTHNPVDDSRGNAEAMKVIFDNIGE